MREHPQEPRRPTGGPIRCTTEHNPPKIWNHIHKAPVSPLYPINKSNTTIQLQTIIIIIQ